MRDEDTYKLIQVLSEFEEFATQISKAAPYENAEAKRIATTLINGRKILKSRFEGWETLQMVSPWHMRPLNFAAQE